MYSIANGVIWQPLPFPEPDRLVRVYDTNLERGTLRGTLALRLDQFCKLALLPLNPLARQDDARVVFRCAETVIAGRPHRMLKHIFSFLHGPLLDDDVVGQAANDGRCVIVLLTQIEK